MFFDISNISFNRLESGLFNEKQVSVTVLRLDELHPVVSGNKLFKLHYYLEDALATSYQTILSFGGAYSNHLVATAFACRSLNIKSIGIVRGEEPGKYSTTLEQCMEYGMKLKFVSRSDYAMKDDPSFIDLLQKEFGACTVIPEGGYHPKGARGAALIMDLVQDRGFSHICTSVGTATTLAGLLMASNKEQCIVGIPVLKGLADVHERISYLTGKSIKTEHLTILGNYHFGGYAKKNDSLIQFMNRCWQQFELPLDFVYTAKMFFGVMNSIEHGFFPPGSNICCLHTGGLQGNDSLKGYGFTPPLRG
jgi:1-aminocyclopropane-1-carboxylate deaminase